MSDQLVIHRPGTCDSYEVVGEKWNRPGKLWVVVIDEYTGEHDWVNACVYAETKEEAFEKARARYEGETSDDLTILEDVVQLTFDANGVSNVWVW